MFFTHDCCIQNKDFRFYLFIYFFGYCFTSLKMVLFFCWAWTLLTLSRPAFCPLPIDNRAIYPRVWNFHVHSHPLDYLSSAPEVPLITSRLRRDITLCNYSMRQQHLGCLNISSTNAHRPGWVRNLISTSSDVPDPSNEHGVLVLFIHQGCGCYGSRFPRQGIPCQFLCRYLTVRW